jgi:hypothetical protein
MATSNPLQSELDFGVDKTKSAIKLEMEDDYEERMSKQFGRGSKSLMRARDSSLSERLNASKSFYIPDIKERMWTKVPRYLH